jgi:hypothetical protein
MMDMQSPQDPDHEKAALAQMIMEAQGRELQLRAALGRAQQRITALEAEIAARSPTDE